MINNSSNELTLFGQDAWHCELCGSTSGRGFGKDITFQYLLYWVIAPSFLLYLRDFNIFYCLKWFVNEPSSPAEATFEVLPRLTKIQFETGVTDELLYLDFPQECRLPSGSMVLEYGKAVHKTVYNQFHVVREGKLRIIFTQDLKVNMRVDIYYMVVNWIDEGYHL